jgi:hypothetical protein
MRPKSRRSLCKPGLEVEKWRHTTSILCQPLIPRDLCPDSANNPEIEPDTIEVILPL